MKKLVLLSTIVLICLVFSCQGSDDESTPTEIVREYIYAVSKADTGKIDELWGGNPPITINDFGKGYDIKHQNIDIKLTYFDEYEASVVAEYYVADQSSGMILPEDHRYYKYGLLKREGQWIITDQLDIR